MNWIDIQNELPPTGEEVVLFSPRWINEDFNPKGVRIGFRDDVSGWVTAHWCNVHDEYHTRTSDRNDYNYKDYSKLNQIPTHWMRIEWFKPEAK